MIGLEPGHAPITLAIVSTNQLVRLGLRAVIKAHAHLRLIGEATSVNGVEDIIARENPHMVLIEMTRDLDILEWVPKMKASVPTTKIIVLSGMEDTRYAWQALSSRIDGVVLSIQPPAALLATIHYVYHGQTKTMPPEPRGTGRMNGIACALTPTGPSPLKASDAVTKREREIIELVGQGLSNKDIAERLCICSTTVRHHLTSIFDKLGVTSRQQLLIRAHQQGLVESCSLLHFQG